MKHIRIDNSNLTTGITIIGDSGGYENKTTGEVSKCHDDFLEKLIQEIYAEISL